MELMCGLCMQVVMVLKKEVMKTQNKDLEKGVEYRHLLVHAIHECAANFPDIAANVIHLLMDFLGDTNSSSALDVVSLPACFPTQLFSISAPTMKEFSGALHQDSIKSCVQAFSGIAVNELRTVELCDD